MSAKFSRLLSSFLGNLTDIHEGYKSVSLTNEETDRDINDILSNAKDRAEFNKVLQTLKEERLKGNVIEKEVYFSNGTKSIKISLE